MASGDNLDGRRIGVFGLGETGLSVVRTILKSPPTVLLCFDDSQKAVDVFSKEFGSQYLELFPSPRWSELDVIFLSPGILHDHPVVKMAKENNIKISSDIDLFYQLSAKNSYFIAVTGTDGKSTTTALIAHTLLSNGHDFDFGGNFQNKAALTLPAGKEGYVLELSSFQLSLINEFTANISILLNIAPDHLDWHKSMDEYVSAKTRIFDRMNSKKSYAVIGIDSPLCAKIFVELSQKSEITCIPISVKEILSKGVSIVNKALHDNISDISVSWDLPCRLQDENVNFENVAASYAACRCYGLSHYQIISALATFQSLPHRVQFVCDICDGKIKFYDDSKATNCHAAVNALKSMENIYWLVGGILKEKTLDLLQPGLRNVAKAYLFGRDRLAFEPFLNKEGICYQVFETLELALNTAVADAENDDQAMVKNILLAPACSSFDQFQNYAERGNFFAKICQELKQQEY